MKKNVTNKKISNKSKTYLLPLLSELIDFELKFIGSITNTYIFDSENEYENCIFIRHEFNFKNPEYTAYEHKLTKSEYFVDLIDIGKEVIYIFKFPEEYLEEYNNFINGRYSYFGADAKELVLSFWTKVYENNPNAIPFLIKVKQILFKDEKLKKKIETDLQVKLSSTAELSDIITKIDETISLQINQK